MICSYKGFIFHGQGQNSIAENIVSLFVLHGANYLLPLITVPYLVRVLGPENFGRVAFAQAFIQFFVILSDYGFNLSATRSVAQVRDDHEALSRLASAVMLVKVVLMVSGFIIMLSIIFVVPAWRVDWTLYVWMYFMVVGNVLFPAWLFQGLERMRHIAVFTILSRLMVVTAIFSLVQHASDYRLAAALHACGTVLAGLFALAFLRHVASIRWHWPGFLELRLVVADGWHVFLSTVSITLYTNSNIFLLGLITNPTMVGYFAAAEKIVKAVQELLGPVSQSVFPYIANLSEHSREATLTFIARLLRWQGACTLFLSVLLFCIAEPLVVLLLGSSFVPSVHVLQWLAPLPFVVGLSNVFGIQTMLNFGMKQLFSHILLVSGLVNVALIVPLVHWFGVPGAAISVLLTEITVTLLMVIFLARHGIMQHITTLKAT